MLYESKKDLRVILPVWGGTLLYFLYGLFLIWTKSGFSYGTGWVMLGIGILILCFIHPIYYRITQTELIVRCGVVRWQIPLLDIIEILPSDSALGSPAWSLDRLQIMYTKRGKKLFVLISPADKKLFLQEISNLTQDLKTTSEIGI